MSSVLAKHFPRQQQYALAINELLVNAIEHGNLEIGFAAKTQLLRSGQLQQEIEKRLALPAYAGRCVHIKVERGANNCSLSIRDEGRGFKPQDYLNRTPDVKLPNGRGLHIAQNAKFDDMKFNETGNIVMCLVKR